MPVRDVAELAAAVKQAEPGDYIELQPGVYEASSGRGIRLRTAGRPDAPIAIGARTLGTVTLRSGMAEGFVVRAPYWIVENLEIEGASGWMVRGNLIADFELLGANRISYGGFMKSNGRGGVFAEKTTR